MITTLDLKTSLLMIVTLVLKTFLLMVVTLILKLVIIPRRVFGRALVILVTLRLSMGLPC